MKMRNLFLLIMLTSGISTLLISCFCKQKTPYYTIKAIKIQLAESNFTEINGDTTALDTIQLLVNPDLVFVAQSQFLQNSLFVNSAFAFHCPGPGDYGLKSKIAEISITSDQIFNGSLAGTELRDFCNFYTATYPQFIDNQENIMNYNHYQIPIALTTKPAETISRKFRVKISFVDGHIVEKWSTNIVWM